MHDTIENIIYIVFSAGALIVALYISLVLITVVSGVIWLFTSILTKLKLIEKPYGGAVFEWCGSALVLIYIINKIQKRL
jgi:hypothetical protein